MAPANHPFCKRYNKLPAWQLKRPASGATFKISGLEQTIPDVEVRFAGYGSPIPNLTVTKIAFWNAGNQTIDKIDIVKANPLFLRGKPPAVILAVEITERTTSYNNFECTRSSDRSGASISFDYLAPHDGVLLQVFHTGTTSDDLSIEGTFKTGRKITRWPSAVSFTTFRPRWLFILTLLLPWSCAAILLYGILDPSVRPGRSTENDSFLLLAWCLVSVLLIFVTGSQAYRLYATSPPGPLAKIHWDSR